MWIATVCGAASSALFAEETEKPTPKPGQRLREKIQERRAGDEKGRFHGMTPAQPMPGTKRYSLHHAGRDRSYLLHTPKEDKSQATNAPATAKPSPMPLVVVLHGFLADGAITEVMSGFSPVADKHGFLVAYPDGLDRMWRFWENPRPAAVEKPARPANGPFAPVDDFGFLMALVDELVKDGRVDPKRVYFTGISNGGFMTLQLGLHYADRIAAIAPVAGSLVKKLADEAPQGRAMPVMIFQGTDDKIVNENGSAFFTKQAVSLTTDELAHFWSKRNGCGAEQLSQLPDAQNDSTTVRKHLFPAGPAGAEVVYYEVVGGGHTWPGGSKLQPEPLLGKTSFDINASELMWEFFSRSSLP